MIANRRAAWNYSLDRSLELAETYHKPLLVLEALRADHPWACDRFHKFILDGMADNAKAFDKSPACYYPYMEKRPGDGKGLLQALSRTACAVVTDEYPAFFLPGMVAAAAKKIKVAMEKVDSNGILPLREPEQVFSSAYQFRRFLQKRLPPRLFEAPKARPFSGAKLPELASVPPDILDRWPGVATDMLSHKKKGNTSSLPIEHSVPAVNYPGGSDRARNILRRFIRNRMSSYIDTRNEPERQGSSGLSPFMHFGHISAHQILHAVTEEERWIPGNMSDRGRGSKNGWWGMSATAEAFLDQLITWRELGFNMCLLNSDYDRFESLPDWAQKTLRAHAKDSRPYRYALSDFEEASTHDPLWNAAQRQLRQEGRIHNYLRMLWGKKILHWSRSPLDALNIMIELNNKYALDGRDPNSYSGIFWVLGRYDRPWGPERPVFGKIRYMTSENTARKYSVSRYIVKYSQNPGSTVS
ncbi:MAG: deoxyribodipyrimidine photolyase [Deltaproteobacteria bacterium]|nr:deoxyribodipyrimidine photolyase [Deltaproteobacteria bacterium]